MKVFFSKANLAVKTLDGPLDFIPEAEFVAVINTNEEVSMSGMSIDDWMLSTLENVVVISVHDKFHESFKIMENAGQIKLIEVDSKEPSLQEVSDFIEAVLSYSLPDYPVYIFFENPL